jgi:hypothetical protein
MDGAGKKTFTSGHALRTAPAEMHPKREIQARPTMHPIG